MARRRRKKLPQGSFRADIESLSHDGRGVAHIDGKVTFIPGALPEEQVEFHYTYVSRKHDEGEVDAVLDVSPQRVEPRCEHFGICGGCSLQHLGSEHQIAYKQQALLDALQRLGGVSPEEIAEPLVSEPWGYRRKARLGVKYVQKKGRVLIGFRERGSSFITDVRRCPVLHPVIGEKIEALAGVIGKLSIKDKIPQIELAMGDEEVILIFRLLSPLTEPDTELLVDFCRRNGWAAYIQEGGPDTVRPLSDMGVTLHYALPEEDISFDFLANDFTQVNTEINRKMIGQAMEWLSPAADDNVLDLFCGLGNFTLPLAKRGAKVTGVEGDEGLVSRARANAETNGIENADFYTANLYADVEDFPWMKESYDAVLLDPPRSGAAEMVPLIVKLGAKRILYVSCYPGTLARDAGMLTQDHGYRLVKAGVMDMFPHTAHVESMALFVK